MITDVWDMAFTLRKQAAKDYAPDYRRAYVRPSWWARNLWSSAFKEPVNQVLPMEAADDFIARTGAWFGIVDAAAPGYDTETDVINMPPRNRWVGTDFISPTVAYYSTCHRMLIHWTGSPKRLCRPVDYLSPVYMPLEMLTATLGQCVLDARFLRQEFPQPNAVAFAKQWVESYNFNYNLIYDAVEPTIEALRFLDTVVGLTQYASGAKVDNS